MKWAVMRAATTIVVMPASVRRPSSARDAQPPTPQDSRLRLSGAASAPSFSRGSARATISLD
jgi:hypothetical protein